MRIKKRSIRPLALGGNANHRAIFRSHSAAFHHPDGDLRALIKGVHQIDIRRRPRIVFGNRHRDNAAFAAAFERMQQRERQSIVDVVAHVGIEDDRSLRKSNRAGQQ